MAKKNPAEWWQKESYRLVPKVLGGRGPGQLQRRRSERPEWGIMVADLGSILEGLMGEMGKE